MKNKTLWLIIAAIAGVAASAYGIWKTVVNNPKKAVMNAIETIGGIIQYNYAAGVAKRRGYISETVKIDSLQDIKYLSDEELQNVSIVLTAVAEGKIKIAQRDEKGHFVKA